MKLIVLLVDLRDPNAHRRSGSAPKLDALPTRQNVQSRRPMPLWTWFIANPRAEAHRWQSGATRIACSPSDAKKNRRRREPAADLTVAQTGSNEALTRLVE